MTALWYVTIYQCCLLHVNNWGMKNVSGLNRIQTCGPFHKRFFHCNSKLIEISFKSSDHYKILYMSQLLWWQGQKIIVIWLLAMELQKNEIPINSLHAKFFRGNINMYLHFMSLLHIDMTQELKILLQVRPVPTYSTQSISLLLMSWLLTSPGHQQPWYSPSKAEITWSPAR